jgi:hypothetical protein
VFRFLPLATTLTYLNLPILITLELNLNMWKHDNFFIGAFSAFILSLFAALLIVLTGPWIYSQFSEFLPQNKFLLLAFLPALFLMRYYMRKLRFDKAGMGALFVIFLFIILYFVFLDKSPVSIFFLNL